ncbi:MULTISPECIES: ABC transporter ATP-binding protein [unclassified Thermotoga]|uniref:ABC transporter ATP-binding protein n=1 Tax=unclassified Thermotoga TaxID=2631113 RepID=UPI000280E6BF|nr:MULTISPECIES: ABC transporter ATP-binding protein [unclassified Thermotoga]AIY87300.1 ABC transporter-like protein [Thermotoga sp. 2812B]EJX26432.1 ABC transporter-like protein [Thermotoga sp. EMP]
MSVIEVRDLTKYYGKSRGVEGVTFSVKEGEIFGFIGPNGAGKTTTIRLLLGLIFPDAGLAEIFRKDVLKEGKEIRKNVGYIPGEVSFYPEVTVEEFLRYSASFYEKVDWDYVKELCGVFSLDTKKRIKELSMGNKKKVAIVQALMHRPKLLILDEPTNGLDPIVQNTFFEILKNEKEKGTTVFFSSHILSEVERLCDRVAMIKDGRIIRVEKVENLKGERYKVVRVKGENLEKLKDLVEVNRLKFENGTAEFLFSGSVERLIEILRSLKLSDFWVEEPSLEEIFMSYYREGEE